MTQPPGQPQPGSPQYGQPPAQFNQAGAQPGQPQFGQPQPYSQQPPAQPYGQQATYAPPASSPMSITGLIFVLLGTVGLVLSFTVLHWFHGDNGVNSDAGGLSTFSKIHKSIEQLDSGAAAKFASFGVSNVYFAWLGWVLAGAAVVLGLIAVSRLGTRTPALKILAAVVAAVGIGITAWAIDIVSFTGPAAAATKGQDGYTEYLKHTSFGAWAAVAGFLLILIGALLPARQR
jgi:hypothetical protein